MVQNKYGETRATVNPEEKCVELILVRNPEIIAIMDGLQGFSATETVWMSAPVARRIANQLLASARELDTLTASE